MNKNILEDSIVRAAMSGGATAHASLPEIYAALMRDEIDAFPALRPHQRHAWHAFLVQLGVLAVHRAGLSDPPEEAEAWRRLLRGLTSDFPDDEPWHLVVDDIAKPAFMQPPASSEDRRKEYKNRVETPDELDMLVTGKNHDLKINVAVNADPDDWLFALLTLQTMEGVYGCGKLRHLSHERGREQQARFQHHAFLALGRARAAGHCLAAHAGGGDSIQI